MPALEFPHPSFCDMNSTDLFKTFWRLCMNSSDWWAKENECKDSEGNRLRSSVKLSVGEDGPEAIAIDAEREFGKDRVIDPDRGPTEGFLEDDSEEGIVGTRDGGCCRIRLSPEAPRPCSCSVMIGDLGEEYCQRLATRAICNTIQGTRDTMRPHRTPCLVYHLEEKLRTNLDIVSYSAAASPASKENRIRAFSVPFEFCARRFPVLRFLGMRSSPGLSIFRPLAVSPCMSPGYRNWISHCSEVL